MLDETQVQPCWSMTEVCSLVSPHPGQVEFVPITGSPALQMALPTPLKVSCPPSLAGPQANAGQVQHSQAAGGAGPTPGLAEKDFRLLLPGSGRSYLQSVPIQLPPALQRIFLACSKSFSHCPRVSTLFLAHALTCSLNASAQQWYLWPSCVRVNTRLPTATQ